jgi:hypothetical protein
VAVHTVGPDGVGDVVSALLALKLVVCPRWTPPAYEVINFSTNGMKVVVLLKGTSLLVF